MKNACAVWPPGGCGLRRKMGGAGQGASRGGQPGAGERPRGAAGLDRASTACPQVGRSPTLVWGRLETGDSAFARLMRRRPQEILQTTTRYSPVHRVHIENRIVHRRH